MDSSMWVGILIGLVALLVAIYATLRGGTAGGLEDVVRRLSIDLAEASQKIADLEQENTQLRAELEQVRQALATLNVAVPVSKLALPARPLLLVIGDKALGRTDETAVERARIPYRRLVNCTAQMLDDELRRRRQDGTLYPWLHLTAHSGPEGIQLADGVVDRNWLVDRQRLQGIKILFLNGCSNVALADSLAGLVDRVIVVYEEIDDRDAGDFCYTFWNAVGHGATADEAFWEALRKTPQVSPYVDIRKA